MPRPTHILCLAHEGEAGRRDAALRLEAWLAQSSGVPLADVCGAANQRLGAGRYRAAIVAGHVGELRDGLAAVASGEPRRGVALGQAAERPPRLAFLFTGHGAQFVGMGRQLYDTAPEFRAVIDACDRALRPHLPEGLVPMLYGDEADNDRVLRRAASAYTMLIAFEHALSALWTSWGVVPDAVIGHSLGEYAAAACAGILSHEEALAVVAAFGAVMDGLSDKGSAAVVFAAPERVAPLVARYPDELALAAINGPEEVLLSGADAPLQAVLAELKAAGAETHVIPAMDAPHSPLIARAFPDTVAVAPRPARCAYVSSMLGRRAAAEEVGARTYWHRVMLQPVNFRGGMLALREHGCELFVEIGPRHTLLRLGQESLAPDYGVWLPSLSKLWTPKAKQAREDWPHVLGTLGQLFVRGVAIDWAAFDRHQGCRPVDLPLDPSPGTGTGPGASA